MNMMSLPHTNGAAKGMQTLWLQSTVEEFFSAVNWDDRPLEVPSSKLSDDESPVGASASGTSLLSYTMSVSQFFDAFPWEGQRAIAAPVPVEAPAPAELPADDITLEDFSDLF